MRKGVSQLFLTVMVFFSLIPAIAFAADPPGIPNGWSDGFIFNNGIRIHYYHAVPALGKPVIIMVHGVTDNGLCWTTLTWEIENSFDIYMLDARGHGLSDPFTPNDDAETLMKDVVGFVKAMNFEKPILMGHSMGAATVMRIGAEYPDLAKAIVMLDPFLASFDATTRNTERKSPPSHPKIEKKEKPKQNKRSVIMFGDPETLVMQNNYSFDDLVAKGRKDNPKWDIVDVKYWALSKKQYHGSYSDEASQAMRGTMRTGNSLANMTVKSLILKADASPEGRQKNEMAVKGLENVKLVHIDGARHNLHHDELKCTVNEINEFLSKL